MKFIQGKDRIQIEMFSLDQAIYQDNEVRLIDLFVGSLSLSGFGFTTILLTTTVPPIAILIYYACLFKIT